ncbi:alpha/beta hydrolase [Leptospira yasudae]|uniref:RBBP9/YdeN family alpha/beta hydrolase n=1 Tax=Leptospira yasudae TaxID=2202201 RepID=UPI000E59A012|nr:alpha/beta hydrolase [Leptospira yasudae]RHX95229.1 alpha/beta hydrolase [Leptospira yasudae]
MKTYLIPGISNSGPDHWQTHWEQKHGFIRVQQKDWEKPVHSDWEKNLLEQLDASDNGKNPILVGHSLGCLLIANSHSKIQDRVGALLLVAPPDPKSTVFPKGLDGFEEFPQTNLGIPGILVYSENDPYSSAEFSQKLAALWGLEAVNIGEKGHINSQSNLGDWEEGFRIYSRLLP